MRRFFAVLMMLVTLHVSAAEALRACASQSSHHQQVKHDGCDTPAPVKAPTTSCCAAMFSCGVSLAIDGAGDEARITPDRRAVIAGRTSMVSALERTPEPPPPKGQA
jgi:hypothetical protein